MSSRPPTHILDDSKETPVCHRDQPTRHYTHLTRPASRVERAILFVFDFEVLSADETGLNPHPNDTEQTVPISTPNLPVFWRMSGS